MRADEITGPDALQTAQRRARFGHRDWIAWRDHLGSMRAARRSPETIKTAMLATGTAGRWFCAAASTGVLYRMDWRFGVTMLRNAKIGC